MRLMDRRTKAAFGAAQRAQVEMVLYLQAMSRDAKQPDRARLAKLMRECERTFKKWMAACAELTRQ